MSYKTDRWRWIQPLIKDYEGKSKKISWAIVSLAMFANFLDQFQASMVNLTLKSMGSSEDLTPFEVNLIVLAYKVSFAAILLIAGTIIDRFGLRLAFLLGNALLTFKNKTF